MGPVLLSGCAAQGLQEGCRRPVPHHTAAYPTAPSLPKPVPCGNRNQSSRARLLPPALIPASQSHGVGTARPHPAPSSTKSLHTRPGAHPARTDGSTTRGQAALGHLAPALHGGERELFVLPGGLFVLKVHLVSETAFQVTAAGRLGINGARSPPRDAQAR